MADQEQVRRTRDAVPSLADLVAPLTVREFVADYWNRRFRAWPGQAGRFGHLIGWDEINAILTTQRLEPPRIMLVRGGKNIATERYTNVTGANRRLNAGAVTAELAQGATLVLSFVDEMVARLGALADRMAGDLGVRCNVNLYAGWRADHGFDLHWDHHDVFIVQVAGRKHWRVQRPTRDHPLRGETAPMPADDDTPVHDEILEEGGILYIPRGWWHVATPVAEPSLHLTIALTAPTGQDYLRWLADKAAGEAVFRADWPVAAGESAVAVHGDSLVTALAALHASHPFAAFLAEQDAARVARPVFTLPDFAAGQMARLTDASRLRLAGARALVPVRDAVSGETGFDIGDRFIPCDADAGAVLGRLSSAGDTRFAALVDGLDAAPRRAVEQLLIRLIAAGAIFVDLGAR